MNTTGEFIYSTISASLSSLAGSIALRQQQDQEDLVQSLGPHSFPGLKADLEQRLNYLATALATGRPAIFHHHMAFLKVAYFARGASLDLLRGNIQAMYKELEEVLPPGHKDMALDYLSESRKALEAAPSQLSSLLSHTHDEATPSMRAARDFLWAMLELRRGEAIAGIVQAMKDGLPLDLVYSEVISVVQHEIGRLWQVNELRVSEEHYASRVVEELLMELRKYHPRQPFNGQTVIISGIGGDTHSLGIKMVTNYLEAAGWRTIELGADTPGREIAEAAEAFSVDLVALGANLAPHVVPAARCIQILRQESAPRRIPVLVGGRPFTQVDDLWKVIGADGSSASAQGAVEVAQRITAASLA